MKSHTDKILLAVFLLSLLAYATILASFIQYGGNNSAAPWLILFLRWLHLRLVLCFHAVPAFCIQMFAARRAKQKWLALLPSILLVSWLVLCLYNWTTAVGWDTLGWILLLWGSIAPAAGCALAWAVFGCWKLYRKGDIHNDD